MRSLMLFAVLSSIGAAGDLIKVSEVMQRWGVSLPLARLNQLPTGFADKLNGASLESEKVVGESSDGREVVILTRTTGVDGNSARNLIQDRRGRIVDFYYIKNQDKMKRQHKSCTPTVVKAGAGKGFALVLLADANRKFGVCDEKEAKYRAVAAWLPCAGKKSLLELNYFFPLKESVEEVLSALEKFSCS